MSNDIIKSSAAPQLALTPTTCFALGRRRIELMASADADDQRATGFENEVIKLTAVLPRCREPGHATSIQQCISFWTLKASEARAESTAKRHEIHDICAKFEEHTRATADDRPTEGIAAFTKEG